MSDSTSEHPQHSHHSNLANKLDPRVHESDGPSQDDGGMSDNKQHPEKMGEDPNVVKDGSKKMTGTGAPGSHSALFGLTPDGSKATEAQYSSSSTVKPAHSEEDSTAASGEGATFTGKKRDHDVGDSDEVGGAGPVDGGVGNRAPGDRDELNNQMRDASVNDNQTTGTTESGMPGSGGSTFNPSQGDGTVGEQGGFMSKQRDQDVGGASLNQSQGGGPVGEQGGFMDKQRDQEVGGASLNQSQGDGNIGEQGGYMDKKRDQEVGGAGPVDGGVGNRAPGDGEQLKNQMNDASLSDTYKTVTSESGKPGTGGSSLGPSQGDGTVRDQSDETVGEQGGFMGKAKAMLFGSSDNTTTE